MYCTRKVTDDVIWVGADSRRLPMFEGVFDVPNGISFNSYLVLDEKTVLFDGADSHVLRTYQENVHHALGGRKLDYLVIEHMEPDHAAAVTDLALRYPGMEIICSGMAKTMLGQFFGDGLNVKVTVVKEGDTLTTGRHTFQFIAAPMVHWPEVLMAYDTADKLLFTADAFGCFGALNGHLFADEVDFDRDYLDETRRYYTNIVGKYGTMVQTVLKKAAALDVAMLLPLHGFVWRKDLGYMLDKYDLWSRYEPEVRGVMIAYASVYGNTENAANILACRLAEQGVPVTMYDTSVTPAPYILSDAFRYSHLVFAATTYNAGVFITMEELLRDIAAHNLQNRTYALVENGSWAPTSGKEMTAIIDTLKTWERLSAPVSLKSSVQDAQRQQLEALADALAADVNKTPAAPAAEEEKPKGRYVCQVCGYVYEGDTLPDGFTCPLCKRPAEFFKKEA